MTRFYPPIYTGAFSGNNDPNIYMVDKNALKQIVRDLLFGFKEGGLKKCILLERLARSVERSSGFQGLETFRRRCG